MRVREWAELEGFNPQTVWKWCREDRMPVPFTRTSVGTVIINDPKYESQAENSVGVVACYGRASSSDQREDLTRQMDRLKAFAINLSCQDPKMVAEVGSGMNENWTKLNRLLADPKVSTIIVEQRDRLARLNFTLIESALKASGRSLIVVDNSEVDNDLVRDMTEVLTSFCARLYGRRSARNKAKAALEVAKNA